MNNFISKASLEARRARYKKGASVELVSMNDPYTKLKPGDTGTVDFVDDTGTVFIIWDSGSHLGVVFGEDEIRLLSKAEVIKEQCRKVAATGRTNMFDTKAVLEIALEMGFSELADLIADTKRYSTLILTGKLDGVE
ncbi:DUF4314 domain-containing protein [Candidatus Micrarchaeota archaeon]|nr:DUF4314 domain-containing protein [Candidatus Micrarchaeota archaeon]